MGAFKAKRASERQSWTTRRLLAWLTQALEEKRVESPRLTAELLVAHALGCERMRLYLDLDRPASPLERQTLRELARRALDHEPIQYITGQAWFYSLCFKADKRALIPRPSSETIVEIIRRHAKASPGFERGVIGDVCAGGGAIAIALLKSLPHARAIATDIDADALALARENAEQHGVADRMEFRQGDLLEALDEPTIARDLHYLVANPPYIPDDEWAAVPANVREHEPARALRGGEDGLDFARRIIAGAADRLRSGGLLAVETAASRAQRAAALAHAQADLANARIEKDLDGLERVVVALRR